MKRAIELGRIDRKIEGKLEVAEQTVLQREIV
jgi:hypothetical protein